MNYIALGNTGLKVSRICLGKNSTNLHSDHTDCLAAT